MILRKYGIELVSLQEADLEQVRLWRNDDVVRSAMFFQEEIPREDQYAWFAALDDSAAYFSIQHDARQIGVINVKDIDWNLRTGEAGIFVGDASYRNSHVPILAILCLMDVFFDEFSFSALYALVRRDNQSAIQLNLDLGYEISQTFEDRFILKVNANNYREKRLAFAQLAGKFTDQEHQLDTEEEKRYLVPRK